MLITHIWQDNCTFCNTLTHPHKYWLHIFGKNILPSLSQMFITQHISKKYPPPRARSHHSHTFPILNRSYYIPFKNYACTFKSNVDYTYLAKISSPTISVTNNNTSQSHHCIVIHSHTHYPETQLYQKLRLRTLKSNVYYTYLAKMSSPTISVTNNTSHYRHTPSRHIFTTPGQHINGRRLANFGSI